MEPPHEYVMSESLSNKHSEKAIIKKNHNWIIFDAHSLNVGTECY